MEVACVDGGTAADNCRRSPRKTRKKIVGRSVSKVSHRKDIQMTNKSEVRLPVLSSGDGAGPLPDAALSTLRSFEHQLGIGSRDYAARCLALAQRFNERPWLQQVRQAVTIATIGVRRVYAHQPHLFAGQSAVAKVTDNATMTR